MQDRAVGEVVPGVRTPAPAAVHGHAPRVPRLEQVPGTVEDWIVQLLDHLQVVGQFLVVADPHLGQLGVTADHREEVVEVVGDASGEGAQRFHALGLLELSLELGFSRDVT